MNLNKAKVPSAVAVGVLAVLTLSVFYVLQDYGPASAIRRFHAALVSNDAAGMQQVIDPTTPDENLKDIIYNIPDSAKHGVPPQIARMDREQGSVRVAVVYPGPNGEKIARIWVVDKKGPLWKINTKLTAAVLRDNLMR